MAFNYNLNLLKNLLLLLILVINIKNNNVSASCQGCVDLDILTFDKLLAKFQYSLVKFDIAFPYGEKHEDFGKFAKNYVNKLNNDLLIGLVGIKDYGEKENNELGVKYSINKEKYPAIMIFKNTTLHAKWPEHLDINYKNIKKFIQDETDLYIGLEGCIKVYDDLVDEFMTAPNNARKALIMDTIKYRSEVDKGLSEYYFKTMVKVYQDGNQYIFDEIKRLQKLLKTKLSSKKKEEFAHKINILKTFEKHITKKNEL